LGSSAAGATATLWGWAHDEDLTVVTRRLRAARRSEVTLIGYTMLCEQAVS
jgi:hypothetical protein